MDIGSVWTVHGVLLVGGSRHKADDTAGFRTTLEWRWIQWGTTRTQIVALFVLLFHLRSLLLNPRFCGLRFVELCRCAWGEVDGGWGGDNYVCPSVRLVVKRVTHFSNDTTCPALSSVVGDSKQH